MISLKPYNTYRLDAYARHVFFPTSVDEIINIYQQHNKVVLLGNGSNVILAKSYYDDTAFMIMQDGLSQISHTENHVYAHSGVLLKTLSLYAYEHSLSGVETFFDVPASLGGAMIMNAGAYGDEIYQHVAYVDILNLNTRQSKRIVKEDIDYGYRYSMFKKMECVILGAGFDFVSKAQHQIKDKMDNILAQRQKKLPANPSAGSVFKRPNYHISVGEMIEKIDLKGYRIGGAEISEKHGGVIVNIGNATGKDILQLIDFMQKEIYRFYRVSLDLEQIVIE